MHLSQIQSIQQDKNYGKVQGNKASNTSFQGIGTAALNGMGKFFQLCDDVPMIGVAFTDTAATNVPRTVVDLKQTGIPAAAETARREFSGLFVNCLIPGAFVYGAAKIVNNNYMKDFTNTMGNPLNLSGSWANGESIKNLVSVWSDYAGISTDISALKGRAKESAIKGLKGKRFESKGFVKSALEQIEGLNGTNVWDKLSDHREAIDEASSLLAGIMQEKKPKGLIQGFLFDRKKNRVIQQAYETLVNGKYTYKDALGNKIEKVVEETGFRATQTLKFKGQNIGSDLRNYLRDAVDIGSALSVSETARMNPNGFVKKATSLVKTKSLMGLAVVIPLAMSMQYINRAITRHKYKKSGAPIYKDFEKEQRVLSDKEKNQLRATKPLAVASIVGLAALSMGKTFPKNLSAAADMLQFNTKFPTLNQCRVIATSTFASRMMAAEDPNELRESTVRDLASFAGLYFLGDYAEKLSATAIQKLTKAGRKGDLQMFNRTKDPSEYKNAWQKFVGWIKDTNIKTFDEIPEQYKKYRSYAKLGGLGFSIALLGVFLPMYNKHVTNKKEAKRKALLEQQKKQNNMYDPRTVFPKKDETKEPAVLSPIEESKQKFEHSNLFSKNPVFSKIGSKFVK